MFDESTQALRGNPVDVSRLHELIGAASLVDWQDGLLPDGDQVPSRTGQRLITDGPAGGRQTSRGVRCMKCPPGSSSTVYSFSNMRAANR